MDTEDGPGDGVGDVFTDDVWDVVVDQADGNVHVGGHLTHVELQNRDQLVVGYDPATGDRTFRSLYGLSYDERGTDRVFSPTAEWLVAGGRNYSIEAGYEARLMGFDLS